MTDEMKETIKNLEYADLVTARTQARHAVMIEEHAEWLRDHTLAMSAHNRAMAEHNLAMERLDSRLEQIAAAHLDLTKRLGGGGNGHGQV
jgi:16S rRNA G527 N7-methylase RsmG